MLWSHVPLLKKALHTLTYKHVMKNLNDVNSSDVHVRTSRSWPIKAISCFRQMEALSTLIVHLYKIIEKPLSHFPLVYGKKVVRGRFRKHRSVEMYVRTCDRH